MLFSAVGLILLGRWLEQKQAQKVQNAAMSFCCLLLKNAGGEDFNQFLMDIPSF